MQRLVFLIDDLTSGGAQRQMINLALAFKQDNYEVSVITYYPRDYYKDILLAEGIEALCVNETNPIKRILSVRKEILKRKPHAVFSYILIPNFIACLCTFPVKKFKLIVGERSADPKLLTSNRSRILRYFHGRSDFIITNSFANERLLRRIVPFYSNRFKVIYNMMNLELWIPSKRFEFKRGGKVRIGVAASHRYLKNARGMIEALMLLNENERSQIEIYWYGKKLSPPYLDKSIIELKYLISKFGLDQSVHLRDETMEIRSEMSKMDAVGLFSYFEGLPNAICEGMALGKPIIASAVSDVPRLIEDNFSGFLFNPLQIDDLAEAFRKLITLSPEEMKDFGERNRKRAEDLFDEEVIFRSFKSLI